ncbi:MAG: PEP-CTERM sorting domain-containing protein [Casimicrobiaceae bacterium]
MREQQDKSASPLRITANRVWTLSAALLCAIGFTAWSGLADAGNIFRGGYDPTAPLLEGFIDVDLPDSCLNSAPGFNFLSAGTGSGDCGQVDVVDATVNSPFPLSFGFDPDVVTGLMWEDGVLQAISTIPFPVGPSLGTTPSYFLGFYMFPSFSWDRTSHTLDIVGLRTSVVLYEQHCYGDGDNDWDDGCYLSPVDTQPATMNGAFARVVPEPGSLALVFGALAVGGLVLRRRRVA